MPWSSGNDRRAAPSASPAGASWPGRSQHELDHLDGVVYLDRLDTLDDLQRVGDDGDLEDV